MTVSSSAVFHGMQAAIGANKYDTDNGCIDAWNLCWSPAIVVTDTSAQVDEKERGYDNFYVELSKYAEKLEAHHKTLVDLHEGKDPDESYDNLFSLDVSVAFGEWFGQYVQIYADAPNEVTAVAAMQELVDKFTGRQHSLAQHSLLQLS